MIIQYALSAPRGVGAWSVDVGRPACDRIAPVGRRPGQASSPVGPRLAERGGFEPPVEVYPLQQISNLSCSATPAPLRARRVAGDTPEEGLDSQD